MLTSMGMDPINFYGESGWWPFIIVAFSAWKGVGYGVVVYLAAILGVDNSLYEAASIDGVSNLYLYSKICMPLSKPIISLIALQTFIGNWNDFFWA